MTKEDEELAIALMRAAEELREFGKKLGRPDIVEGALEVERQVADAAMEEEE